MTYGINTHVYQPTRIATVQVKSLRLYSGVVSDMTGSASDETYLIV
jgi:hypothetical protein